MHEVVEAIDFLLGDVLHLPVQKALNPNNKRDFVLISRQLEQAVASLSGRAEADALREALDVLDVDWASMKPGARDRVVAAAKAALAKPAKTVAPKVEETFTVFGQRIVGATKTDAKRRYKLDISTDLDATDEKVIVDAGSSQANFVRDAFGTRSEALSTRVRGVVSAGLEEGLGSGDITARIKDHLGEEAKARSDAYWGMVAMTFANRARTYGNLAGYAGAGIDYFHFEAVMDERTSVVCRLMHGRRFQVARALDRYKQVERSKDPEAVYDLQPWLRVSDGQVVYDAGGKTRRVANLGEDGGFSKVMSNAKLEAAGITTPPLHGNCRSTIIPDETGDAEEVSVSVPEQLKPPPPPSPEPPPPPPAPAAPAVATPEGLQQHLRGAFSRFDASRWNSTPAGRKENKAAQAEIRQGMRGYLDDRLGASNVDVAEGRAGADVYETARRIGGGALAQHHWDGKVLFREDIHANAMKVLEAVERGLVSELANSRADAVRVLFHEEIHGYSKIEKGSYQGVGVAIEEAQTEILARKMAREFLGEKALGDPSQAKRWALPEVTPGLGVKQRYRGGFGSYDRYIGNLLSETVDAGVATSKVGRAVEDAMGELLKYKTKVKSGEEHVDRFVDELVKAGHLTSAASAALRTRLKNPRVLDRR